MKRILIFVLLLISYQVLLAQEEVFFYHSNPTGSPIAITDENGDVVWKADYKPFGEETNIEIENIDNQWRFLGKEKDTLTGLSYLESRYYKASIGRLYSCDPISLINPSNGDYNSQTLHNPQRFNYYSYALNNPYKVADKNGEYAELAIDIISVGLSFNDFRTDPSFQNGAWLTADILGAILPIVPSAGIFRHTGKIDEAFEFSRSLDKLSEAGKRLDQAGNNKELSKAGRALQKKYGHSQSSGNLSTFTKPTGEPTNINSLGQFDLNDILTDPSSTFTIAFDKNLKKNVIDVTSPTKGTARFDLDGNMVGFRELKK